MVKEPTKNAVEVTVVEFDLPFWSIVKLLVKWSIPAIPAMVILTIIGSVLFALLAGIGTAFNPLGRSSNSIRQAEQGQREEHERLRRICETSSPAVRESLELCKEFR